MIPVSEEEVCCLRLHLDSIIIDDQYDKNTSVPYNKQQFSKILQLRNFIISCSPILKIERAILLLDQPDSNRTLFKTLLLNPFTLTATFNILCSLGLPFKIHTISMDLKLEEAQVNLQSSSMRLLILATQHFKVCTLNRGLLKLKSLVKELYSDKTFSRAKILWKIAYFGVRFLCCGANPMFKLQLQIMKRNSLLSEYSGKYLQWIWSSVNTDGRIPADILPFYLRSFVQERVNVAEISNRLDELHNVLSTQAVVKARNKIDSILIFGGFDPALLQRAIVQEMNGTPKSSRLANLFWFLNSPGKL